MVRVAAAAAAAAALALEREHRRGGGATGDVAVTAGHQPEWGEPERVCELLDLATGTGMGTAARASVPGEHAAMVGGGGGGGLETVEPKVVRVCRVRCGVCGVACVQG